MQNKKRAVQSGIGVRKIPIKSEVAGSHADKKRVALCSVTRDPNQLKTLFPHHLAAIFFARESLLASESEQALLHALSDLERERADRFVDRQAKRLFLLSRIILRQSLSCLFAKAPAHWIFEPRDRGKPELVPQSDEERGIHFNISHTAGLAAIVVSSVPIGIDVELLDPSLRLDQLAAALSQAELLAVQAAPTECRLHTFLQIWCMKESYLKACGTGLAGDLSQVSMVDTVPNGAGVPCQFVDSPSWTVSAWRPTDDHMGSIAVRGRFNDEDVSVYEWVTLSSLEARPFVRPPGLPRYIEAPFYTDQKLTE